MTNRRAANDEGQRRRSPFQNSWSPDLDEAVRLRELEISEEAQRLRSLSKAQRRRGRNYHFERDEADRIEVAKRAYQKRLAKRLGL